MTELPSPEEVAKRGIERIRKAREKEERDFLEQERRNAEALRLQYLKHTDRKEMKP